MPRRKIALVYQAGIANVFDVTAPTLPPKRMMQADFRTCESFARGCKAMGAIVKSLACNVAGDVSSFVDQWSSDLESAPFSDQFHPVKS